MWIDWIAQGTWLQEPYQRDLMQVRAIWTRSKHVQMAHKIST